MTNLLISVKCEQRNISDAYHVICNNCATKTKENPICVKCQEPKLNKDGEVDMSHQNQKYTETDLMNSLVGLPERKRRSIRRKVESGELTITEAVLSLLSDKEGEDQSEQEEEEDDDII